MIAPIPVYFEPDEIEDMERHLDEQLGIEPKPRRERAWDCLAGDVELVCGHPRIERMCLAGRNHVTCLTCAHEWWEFHIEMEVA